MTDTAQAPARRIRPWLAALLTIFGWGVGFYYARRSRTAFWMAALSVFAGVMIGVGVFAYALLTRSAPPEIFDSLRWTMLDTFNLAVTGTVALAAWIVAARRKTVEQGGPARLWGYFAIALLPLIVSVALAMALRFTLVQPFRMPSGSMQPTLAVGDYFAVSKGSYGYGRYSFAPFERFLPAGRAFAKTPQRGDVVVFRPTPDPDRDFVKRLIGMPGDRIQMIDGALHINDLPVERESLGLAELEDEDGIVERIPSFRETLPNGVSYLTFDRTQHSELDNTRVFVVPEGHYFMMGDDRDNSADSRVPSVVGFVPFDNLVGRVDFIMRRPTPDR